MIPVEAVEAAWNAMPLDAYVDNQEQVRAMLEAAAPYIEQAAYDRGFDDGHRAGQESMETE